MSRSNNQCQDDTDLNVGIFFLPVLVGVASVIILITLVLILLCVDCVFPCHQLLSLLLLKCALGSLINNEIKYLNINNEIRIKHELLVCTRAWHAVQRRKEEKG